MRSVTISDSNGDLMVRVVHDDKDGEITVLMRDDLIDLNVDVQDDDWRKVILNGREEVNSMAKAAKGKKAKPVEEKKKPAKKAKKGK